MFYVQLEALRYTQLHDEVLFGLILLSIHLGNGL